MAFASLRAWLVVLFIALVSVHAQAETIKTQCIQANTNAQSLRRDGKLSEAREQLRFCSQAKCPGLVVADCVKRLDELENAQPTVAFDVVNTSGREVNDVAVSIDGRPLLDKLTGGAVAVNLGEHALTFTAEGRPPVQKKFVFREGEKGRHLEVTLDAVPGSAPLAAATTPAAAAPSEPNTAPATESTPSSESSSGSTRRTIGFVVGGVGIASLAAGGVFGVLAIQAKKQQTDNCSSATTCPDHAGAAEAHHNARTYGTISTVTFIAGAAATATGLVLILTAKPSPRNAASASVTVFPSAGPDGAGVAMAGSF